jgi:hypothetical protein
MRFPNEIFVYVQTSTQYRKVRTCDTVKEAEDWIEIALTRGDYPREYSIDGTPRAWFEQTGQCGCLVGETCEGCTA